MERHREITDLAALLDGELKDSNVEALYAQLNDDDGLREEFELQREVKTALSQLPEEPAPDFMTTRVLGEIATRRNRKTGLGWRTVAAALGGFSFCLVVVFGVMFINNGGMNPGQQPTTLASEREFAHQPVGTLDGEFRSGHIPMIPVSADASAQDFMKFAIDQHDYSTRLNSTDSLNRDLAGVILLLENGETIYISPEDIE